jgi:cation diffusion facilitator family transporter
VTSSRVDLRLATRIATAGIIVSASLSALNIFAGLASRSTSVLATGMEFAGDVLASAVVLAGMIAAGRPADDEHPYGHGRLETLAASFVGVLLIAGGVGLCWNSLQAIGDVHPPPTRLAIIALVIAIAVRAGMGLIKFRVGRRLQSAALIADAWNDAVDILAGVAALTAVALAMYDPGRFLAADHYGGFAVGLIVVLTGVRVLRDASLELMDTMPADDRMIRLRDVASSVPRVAGVEKAFARKTGLQYHVDLHIEVDPALTVADAHAIGGEVRSRVKQELPWVADVLVHVEPARTAGG